MCKRSNKLLRYDKLDALAFGGTHRCVIVWANIGLVLGLFVPLQAWFGKPATRISRLSGQIGDTGIFVMLHAIQWPQFDDLLIIRIDESLFYGNAQSVLQFIEQTI